MEKKEKEEEDASLASLPMKRKYEECREKKNICEQSYALLGYRTTARTSTEATPYLLIYGTEAVIPAKVEIPSLRIIQEAELKDAEWVKNRYEQLAMIEEKRMVAMCHGQLYRQRMSKAFNKRVRTRLFQIGQLVLKRVFPHQEEYKGKFAPNWQGPYMVRKVLLGGAVVLAEMDGQEWPKAINADALKRYYVSDPILLVPLYRTAAKQKQEPKRKRKIERIITKTGSKDTSGQKGHNE
ncbi:uncharacterized protein LOC132043241 [Lycium ferocissimum]|uniref:uncharacterized protein LOC132043241 n=1 Tax=Lycium ferocissimum TaxID=112874 RepID=UPI002815DA5A|nr:uncharacterized protein LOC132043241 [Lycium ferocissimum]